jgi:protein ImuB
MFACVHARQGAPALPLLAALFSPDAELADEATIVFSINGLRRLIGTVNDIASAISARGMELKITGNLAIAAQPDTAILGARHLTGVSLIPPGQEIDFLGRILVGAATTDVTLIRTLERWGIRTLGELAALPPLGVMERLGEPADRLRRLALGMVSRPLRLHRQGSTYTVQIGFDDPLQRVEEVVAALTAPMEDLTAQAVHQGQAVRCVLLSVQLQRDGCDGTETHRLPLPVPARSPGVLLKQVQLHLEAHPLPAPVKRLELTLEPASPQTLQGGLYLPPTPEPDRLKDVLLRITSLVGPENVGTPELADTHRPDAHRIRQQEFVADARPRDAANAGLRLAFRYFRPALTARVETRLDRPARVSAIRVNGQVAAASGPWRTSGEWWAQTSWNREEWDVALSGGGLYRIYLDLAGHSWFVEGMYD